MTKLKIEILQKFARTCLPEDRVESFQEALLSANSGCSTVVWLREQVECAEFGEHLDNLPELLPKWAQVPRLTIGLGKHPAHVAGQFYLADLSSVLFGSMLKDLVQSPQVVLDLCAAPGGKSILAWRSLRPGLLLSNEVVRKRLAILISNLKRCESIAPVGVYGFEPSAWATQAERSVDLLIVDAPCSAQSLGAAAEFPFHKSTISGNAKRQRGILDRACSMVKPGGYLHYITCTFAPQENEKTVAWFLKRHPEFAACAVPAWDRLRSHLSEFPSYRIWPDQGLGRGGFACLLQRDDTGAAACREVEWPQPLWSR